MRTKGSIVRRGHLPPLPSGCCAEERAAWLCRAVVRHAMAEPEREPPPSSPQPQPQQHGGGGGGGGALSWMSELTRALDHGIQSAGTFLEVCTARFLRCGVAALSLRVPSRRTLLCSRTRLRSTS